MRNHSAEIAAGKFLLVRRKRSFKTSLVCRFLVDCDSRFAKSIRNLMRICRSICMEEPSEQNQTHGTICSEQKRHTKRHTKFLNCPWGGGCPCQVWASFQVSLQPDLGVRERLPESFARAGHQRKHLQKRGLQGYVHRKRWKTWYI